MAKKVKILGGEIKKKLNIKLPISASAKEAVEKAGGKVFSTNLFQYYDTNISN